MVLLQVIKKHSNSIRRIRNEFVHISIFLSLGAAQAAAAAQAAQAAQYAAHAAQQVSFNYLYRIKLLEKKNLHNNFH
jgi:hypothetical protein